MGRSDHTDIGGTQEAFLTTHWSLIEGLDTAKTQDRNRALIDLLLRRYWKPVYCFLRRKGYKNEECKDLTQSFFHEVVLNRNLIQRADRSKGRFRSFLLHALTQYVANQRKKQNAQKRIPSQKLVSIDIVDETVFPQTISTESPEDSYNYAWLSALLDRILLKVETECCEDGLEQHWNVFHDRIVQPILNCCTPPSLAGVCVKYDIDSEKKASNMAITVKRRFQEALRQYVRSTVVSDSMVGEELAEIMQFFPEEAQHLK